MLLLYAYFFTIKIIIKLYEMNQLNIKLVNNTIIYFSCPVLRVVKPLQNKNNETILIRSANAYFSQ